MSARSSAAASGVGLGLFNMTYEYAAPAEVRPNRDCSRGSREDAEDLVQETLARVLSKPRMLRSDTDLGYLLRVLRNTSLSGRRTAARRPHTVPMPEAPGLIEDRSACQPHVNMEHVELYQAVAPLPEIFRDVLVAVDVVGLLYREAARALHLREATVTTRLHRARQRVARQLAV